MGSRRTIAQTRATIYLTHPRYLWESSKQPKEKNGRAHGPPVSKAMEGRAPWPEARGAVAVPGINIRVHCTLIDTFELDVDLVGWSLPTRQMEIESGGMGLVWRVGPIKPEVTPIWVAIGLPPGADPFLLWLRTPFATHAPGLTGSLQGCEGCRRARPDSRSCR
jgi:hypothetical protein